MKFTGCMNFYSKINDKLHKKMKPLYDSLRDNIKNHWDNELETLFQQIKISITKDGTLSLSNTNHPFFIAVYSSLIRIGCLLFQMKDKRKLIFIFFKLVFFITSEQNLSTIYLKLFGIVFSQTIYEQNIIGSVHLVTVLNNHKPITPV